MTTYKEGDFFYTPEKDEETGKDIFRVFRCLKIEPEYNAAHVTMFEPMDRVPTESDIADLQIRMLHLPIAIDGFENPQTISNAELTKEDLEGYYAYLKFADFQTWAKETDADIDALSDESTKLFDKATELSDKEKFAEAADLYFQAYETFPPYFESVDNAGLCLMDAGDYENAIGCFEESIEANDHSFLTDFSIAQCLQYLDDLDGAKEWYEKARDLPDATAEEKEMVAEVLAAF